MIIKKHTQIQTSFQWLSHCIGWFGHQSTLTLIVGEQVKVNGLICIGWFLWLLPIGWFMLVSSYWLVIKAGGRNLRVDFTRSSLCVLLPHCFANFSKFNFSWAKFWNSNPTEYNQLRMMNITTILMILARMMKFLMKLVRSKSSMGLAKLAS